MPHNLTVPHTRREREAFWQEHRKQRDETKAAQRMALAASIKARYNVNVTINPLTDIPKLLAKLAAQHKKPSIRKTHMNRAGQIVPTRYPKGRA